MKGEGQALTDELIARLRPRSITYMRADSGTRGLYLAVRPTGTKSWLLKLSDESGTARKMSGGTYGPTSGTHGTVSLDEARTWARNIQGVASEGVALHVAQRRVKLDASGVTFEQCARIWHARVTKSGRWKARYSATVLRMMERDIFSAKIEGSSKAFGEWRPRDIDHAAVTAVNRSVEQRGAVDTAADINMYIRAVFDEECLPSGHCSENPAARTHKQLSKPVRTHFASLKFGQLAEFFERLDQYPGDESTKIALELLVMLAPRSTEFRFARWSELQLDAAVPMWRVPEERMKDMAARRKAEGEYLVPLAPAAVALFKRLHKLTGSSPYLFPGRKWIEPVSSATWLEVLKSDQMGYRNQATVHGFRSTFSTTANEAGFPTLAIERQLDHFDGNAVRAAYNRAEYLDQRIELMHWWAEQVASAKKGASTYVRYKNWTAPKATRVEPQNSAMVALSSMAIPLSAASISINYSFNTQRI